MLLGKTFHLQDSIPSFVRNEMRRNRTTYFSIRIIKSRVELLAFCAELPEQLVTARFLMAFSESKNLVWNFYCLSNCEGSKSFGVAGFYDPSSFNGSKPLDTP